MDGETLDQYYSNLYYSASYVPSVDEICCSGTADGVAICRLLLKLHITEVDWRSTIGERGGGWGIRDKRVF